MINIKIQSEEDVNSICSLLELCLAQNKVIPERVEPVKEIVQGIRNQRLDLPGNQEELNHIRKVISDLESTVEKVKGLEQVKDDKIMVTLDNDWKQLMQNLIENVNQSRKGIEFIMKQNDSILERFENMESNTGKDNKENKPADSQINTIEEGGKSLEKEPMEFDDVPESPGISKEAVTEDNPKEQELDEEEREELFN